MHSINSALYEMRVYEKRLYEIGGYRIFVLMKSFQNFSKGNHPPKVGHHRPKKNLFKEISEQNQMINLIPKIFFVVYLKQVELQFN